MAINQSRTRKERSDKGKSRTGYSELDRTYSFKLNPKVEGEDRVIELLDTWLAETDKNGRRINGLRSIIRGLVLNYSGQLPPSADISLLGLEDVSDQFTEQLTRMEQIIERLNQLGVSTPKSGKQKSEGLNENYLSNLRKALRGEDD